MSIQKQKTLIVTSIYSNLWGTEYGGRASRYHHYRVSLLTMLNMKPEKVICFTSQEELEDLKKFFYTEKQISEDLLEFKVFDLSNSDYFNILREKKDPEQMKTFDRCFEIQYNKFFWVKNLENIHDFDKVYWFDAGLSHSGLFPDCFAYGGSYERNFQFSVFDEGFLETINKITDEKFLLVGKNNTHEYYWSVTIPEKYYDVYCKDLHIIGGFFGGTPQSYLDVVESFDKILSRLLISENGLFMEEQILSCMYYNNKNFYEVLVFDDWYKKEFHNDKTKLFYHIFSNSEDCDKNNSNHIEPHVEDKKLLELLNIDDIEKTQINSQSVFVLSCLDRGKINTTKKSIESILQHTNLDIMLATDFVNEFSVISDERIKIIPYSDFFNDEKTIQGFPNFHINRHLFKVAVKFDYQYIIYSDGIEISEWNDEIFYNFIKKDFDISFLKSTEPQMRYLIDNFEHYKSIIELEIDDLYDTSLDDSPNPESYFFIVKNNEKLKTFLDFWDILYEKNNGKYPTYYCGVYLGVLSLKSDMKITSINDNLFFKI